MLSLENSRLFYFENVTYIIEQYFLDISTLKLMFTSQKKKSEKPKVSCIFECSVVDSPRSNDCLLKFTTRKLLQDSNTALCCCVILKPFVIAPQALIVVPAKLDFRKWTNLEA